MFTLINDNFHWWNRSSKNHIQGFEFIEDLVIFKPWLNKKFRKEKDHQISLLVIIFIMKLYVD